MNNPLASRSTNKPARGPTEQQRTIVIGRTGSGKSVFAIALLSTRNFNDMPWVIIDYKGEDLIDEIRLATGGRKHGAIKILAPTDNPPVEAGLYWMKPRPILDDADVEAFLWKCHGTPRGPIGKKKYVGNIGLFIDEGYCLPQKAAFDVILTQGRSLYIPVIVLYQRPVWMSRFAVAQADYVAAFEQMDERDMKTAASFVKPAKLGDGSTVTVFNDLPEYYCLWYDVGRGSSTVLRPAPAPQSIIETFKTRLIPAKHKVLI
jgi:hypothetical protein